jgi:hypothetical protein
MLSLPGIKDLPLHGAHTCLHKTIAQLDTHSTSLASPAKNFSTTSLTELINHLSLASVFPKDEITEGDWPHPQRTAYLCN